MPREIDISKKRKYNGVYFMSGKRYTFRVIVKQNVVIGAAPVARRFIGQHIQHLIKWFNIDRISSLEGRYNDGV